MALNLLETNQCNSSYQPKIVHTCNVSKFDLWFPIMKVMFIIFSYEYGVMYLSLDLVIQYNVPGISHV